MSRRSWRMGWGKMEIQLDEQAGRAVGSRIRLAGRVFGVWLELEEVVTEYTPPARKVWATIGRPRLLVIGPYRMGFELVPEPSATGSAGSDGVTLTVFSEYRLPDRGLPRLLGRLLGHAYARWCTARMVADAAGAFAPSGREEVASQGRRPAVRGRELRGAVAITKASLFHTEIAAWLGTPILALAKGPRWAAGSAALALALDLAGRLWSRGSPEPMPFFMRWVLHLPRGPHSPARVERLLAPRSGERILEIGPGVGVHALRIAPALQPGGVLEVLDVQHEMLAALVRRAAKQGLGNVVARQGDVQRLPYPDARFSAAYLVSVLGEIPDPKSALRELRRVLEPAGRLLVCEVALDPDFISLPALRRLAADADFQLERSVGPRFAYSALLRAAASGVAAKRLISA